MQTWHHVLRKSHSASMKSNTCEDEARFTVQVGREYGGAKCQSGERCCRSPTGALSKRPTKAQLNSAARFVADFINTIDPKRTRCIGTEASPLRSGRDCSSNVFDPISDCAGSLSLMRWESNIRYTQRSPASPTKRRVEFRQPFRENLASSKT